MTATLQPTSVPHLASKFGRTGFSRSMCVSPERPGISVALKVTLEPRQWIADDLVAQPSNERAIIFCLFKKHVAMMVTFLKLKIMHREILECTSGATADLAAFKTEASGVMVCTTVLSTGVTFERVTRVYFVDCCHGPEAFLQGAGRGARGEGEQCVSTLVTSKSQLQYFMHSEMPQIGNMATFCYEIIDSKLDFSTRIYKLFEHQCSDEVSSTLELAGGSAQDMPVNSSKRRRVSGALDSSTDDKHKVCEELALIDVVYQG